MIRIIRFLLLALFFAPACKAGPDYERPVVPEHDAYRDAVPADTTAVPPADSIADLAWWDLFQDTVLQNLIWIALENNKELDVSLARIAEARANLGFSRADLYPEVNVIANTAVDGNTEEDVTASGLIAADAFWQVDLWGRIRRSNEAALNELLATEEAYRAVTISLVADVASFYLLLRDFDNRQTISENTVETRRPAPSRRWTSTRPRFSWPRPKRPWSRSAEGEPRPRTPSACCWACRRCRSRAAWR
jgi:multidrug efflux system outer membrane protein